MKSINFTIKIQEVYNQVGYMKFILYTVCVPEYNLEYKEKIFPHNFETNDDLQNIQNNIKRRGQIFLKSKIEQERLQLNLFF